MSYLTTPSGPPALDNGQQSKSERTRDSNRPGDHQLPMRWFHGQSRGSRRRLRLPVRMIRPATASGRKRSRLGSHGRAGSCSSKPRVWVHARMSAASATTSAQSRFWAVAVEGQVPRSGVFQGADAVLAAERVAGGGPRGRPASRCEGRWPCRGMIKLCRQVCPLAPAGVLERGRRPPGIHLRVCVVQPAGSGRDPRPAPRTRLKASRFFWSASGRVWRYFWVVVI